MESGPSIHRGQLGQTVINPVAPAPDSESGPGHVLTLPQNMEEDPVKDLLSGKNRVIAKSENVQVQEQSLLIYIVSCTFLELNYVYSDFKIRTSHFPLGNSRSLKGAKQCLHADVKQYKFLNN